MKLLPVGIEAMMEWVRAHRPECLPDDPEDTSWRSLFPHNLEEATPNENDSEVMQKRGLTDNELLVELAGRKCIAEGTLIETTNGPKRIEEVQVGDRVVVPEGDFEVTNVSNNGPKDIVVVETTSGYAVMCTPDHLIMTEGGWVEAGSLGAGDVLRLAPGVSKWGGYGTFAAGYTTGLFLGDGTFAGENFLVANLRLFGDKMKLMTYIEQLTGGKSSLYRDGRALSINSKAWGEQLAALGIVHGSRKVTQAIELASSDFQRGVLMGLWDTDGSLENNKKTRRAYYCSSDRESLGAVQRMLLRFGILSRIRLDRPAQDHLVICGVSTAGKAAYKLTITGASFVRFASIIGSYRRGEALRKAAEKQQRKSPSAVFGEVHAVQPFGSCNVYDLSVAPGSPHSFVANGIVVHNCYDSFGKKAGKKSNKEYIANTQAGAVPHASILYHAKMSFFIAGVSRRVSHELIRNYVGADRDEEGSPSQESTRFTHHYGFFIAPPRYITKQPPELEAIGVNRAMINHFKTSMQSAYDNYLYAVDEECTQFSLLHGKAPTGIDKKRIYEAASSFLPHQAETSFIWTTNPMAIAKFVRERADASADLEIQRLARTWAKVCMDFSPNLFPQAHMREAAYG